MGKVRDFKFGVQIDRQTYKPRNAKVGQKGRGLRHVSYFYKDELYAAKTELVKFVAQLPSAPDGWSKLLASKGEPIVRKGSDGAHRRSQEAEDVMDMITILDGNKIDLPKLVAADLDRIPSFVTRPAIPAPAASSCSTDEVLQRLQAMEQKLAQLCTVPTPSRLHQSYDSGQWRIQNLQTGGGKVERRRREYRGAEGAEGVPYPLGEGSGEGAVPPPHKIFLTLDLKMSTSSAF